MQRIDHLLLLTGYYCNARIMATLEKDFHKFKATMHIAYCLFWCATMKSFTTKIFPFQGRQSQVCMVFMCSVHIQQSSPNYLGPYQIFIVSTVPTSNLTYVTAGRDAGIKNLLGRPTATFIKLIYLTGGLGGLSGFLFRRPYNFYAVIEFEYSPISNRIQKCFLRVNAGNSLQHNCFII